MMAASPAPGRSGLRRTDTGDVAEFAADAVPFGDPSHALFGGTGTLSHEPAASSRRGWIATSSAA